MGKPAANREGMTVFCRTTLPAVFLFVLSTSAVAATVDESPLEPADTSSPRAMLRGFMDDTEEAYRVVTASGRGTEAVEALEPTAQRLAQCFDLSEVPAYLVRYKAGEAIVCVREVIDRIGLPDWEEIPDEAMIEAESENGEFNNWRLPGTAIMIVRLGDGPRQGEWVFCAGAVDHAQDYFRLVRNMPYKPGACRDFRSWYLSDPGSSWLRAIVNSLPGWARERVWHQSVWQWVGLVIVMAVSLAAMTLAYAGGSGRAAVFQRVNLFRYWVTLWFPLAAMLVPMAAKYVISEELRVSGRTLAVARFTCDLIFLAAVCVVIISVANRVAAALIARPSIKPRGIDAQFIRLMCRLVGIVASGLIFLEGGQYLGIPLTTLLAGAGVGGLTIALAAQDTLKNIFGSMMVILDKPYRVGERIVVGRFDGVVEEIGLRSTKLRLLTGHQVSVPNEEMARSQIENIGRRPHIRCVGDLAITLDTPPEKVRRALEIVRNLLKDHEGQPADFPPRVFFDKINRDSNNLRFIYWYEPAAYWDFVAYGERFNLQVLEAFDREGIELALPITKVDIEGALPEAKGE